MACHTTAAATPLPARRHSQPQTTPHQLPCRRRPSLSPQMQLQACYECCLALHHTCSGAGESTCCMTGCKVCESSSMPPCTAVMRNRHLLQPQSYTQLQRCCASKPCIAWTRAATALNCRKVALYVTSKAMPSHDPIPFCFVVSTLPLPWTLRNIKQTILNSNKAATQLSPSQLKSAPAPPQQSEQQQPPRLPLQQQPAAHSALTEQPCWQTSRGHMPWTRPRAAPLRRAARAARRSGLGLSCTASAAC